MFAELSFSLKKIDVDDDINLYKPVAANEELQRNEKLTFGQLEVELGKKIQHSYYETFIINLG